MNLIDENEDKLLDKELDLVLLIQIIQIHQPLYDFFQFARVDRDKSKWISSNSSIHKRVAKVAYNRTVQDSIIHMHFLLEREYCGLLWTAHGKRSKPERISPVSTSTLLFKHCVYIPMNGVDAFDSRRWTLLPWRRWTPARN